MSNLELSILSKDLFNGSHKGAVHKARLDQVHDNPRLIPENAAPEGGPNLLIWITGIGGANGVTGTCWSSKYGECPEGLRLGGLGGGVWGREVLDTTMSYRGDGIRWGDTPEYLTPRPLMHGGGGRGQITRQKNPIA